MWEILPIMKLKPLNIFIFEKNKVWRQMFLKVFELNWNWLLGGLKKNKSDYSIFKNLSTSLCYYVLLKKEASSVRLNGFRVADKSNMSINTKNITYLSMTSNWLKVLRFKKKGLSQPHIGLQFLGTSLDCNRLVFCIVEWR